MEKKLDGVGVLIINGQETTGTEEIEDLEDIIEDGGGDKLYLVYHIILYFLLLYFYYYNKLL